MGGGDRRIGAAKSRAGSDYEWKICTPNLSKKTHQNRKSGLDGASTFFVDRPVRASPRAIRVT